MEAAGLVIGIAALLSDCLELIDRIDRYKDAGISVRSALHRWDAQKIRLEEWSSAAGFRDGRLLDRHSPRLDQTEIAALVTDVLQTIVDTFRHLESQLSSVRAGLQRRPTDEFGASHRQGKPAEAGSRMLKATSKLASLKWALRTGSRTVAHVETVEALVDALYQIVPPSDNEATNQTGVDISALLEDSLRASRARQCDAVQKWISAPRTDFDYRSSLALDFGE